MARTSKSRGKTNFKLDNSPYPLFNPITNALTGGLFNRLRNKIKGGGDGDESTLGGKLDSINEKLDQLTSSDSGSGSGDVVLGGNKDIDPAELAANKAKKAAMGGGDDEELLQKEV